MKNYTLSVKIEAKTPAFAGRYDAEFATILRQLADNLDNADIRPVDLFAGIMLRDHNRIACGRAKVTT